MLSWCYLGTTGPQWSCGHTTPSICSSWSVGDLRGANLLKESISRSVWKLAHERRRHNRDKPPREKRTQVPPAMVLRSPGWHSSDLDINSSLGPVSFVSYPLNLFFHKLIWIGLSDHDKRLGIPLGQEVCPALLINKKGGIACALCMHCTPENDQWLYVNVHAPTCSIVHAWMHMCTSIGGSSELVSVHVPGFSWTDSCPPSDLYTCPSLPSD